jgi:hypothetical protein
MPPSCKRSVGDLRARLESGLTQAQAAEEAGNAVDSVTLIRVLRALGMNPNLESLLPDVPQSPVALLKNKGRQRTRVKHPQKAKNEKATTEAGLWKWGK